MKRCPTCNFNFADDDLGYCTYDGAALVHVEDSAPAELLPTQLFQTAPVPVVVPPPPTSEFALGREVKQQQVPEPYGWANEAAPTWTPPPPPVIRQQQQQTMAVLSLVFGIAAITVGWICGGPLLSLVAIALGVVALSQIKRNPLQYTGKPLALGGIITGAIVLLIYLVLLVIWIGIMIAGSAASR